MFLLGFLLVWLIAYYTAVDILAFRKRRRRNQSRPSDCSEAMSGLSHPEAVKQRDGYKEWWYAQFPCPCEHPPDEHALAPRNGTCRGCRGCHGEGGMLLGFGEALGQSHEG